MNFDDLMPQDTYSMEAVSIGDGNYTELAIVGVQRVDVLSVENTTDKVIQLAVGPENSEAPIPEYIAPGVAKNIRWTMRAGDRLSCAGVGQPASGLLVVTLKAQQS